MEEVDTNGIGSMRRQEREDKRERKGDLEYWVKCLRKHAQQAREGFWKIDEGNDHPQSFARYPLKDLGTIAFRMLRYLLNHSFRARFKTLLSSGD